MKYETSMTTGFAGRFLVPTLGGTTGGVRPQPMRRRDAAAAWAGNTVALVGDAGRVVATSAPLPGSSSAPPIT